MSIGVIVEFRCKADSDGATLATNTFKERLPSVTRKYDGCEHIYLYADPNDPNHLFLVERWVSRDKYEKYREWAMTQPGTEDLLAVLDGEMTTVYLDDTGA